MIRKISSGEYLRRYDNMSAVERGVYEKRVGEWLQKSAPMLMTRTEGFEAQLQNVITVSAGWNDSECAEFEEGARLLSALVNRGETWLPEMLYVKAAGRCVRRMVRSLSPIPSPIGRGVDTIETTIKPEAQGQPVKRGAGRTRKNERPAADATGTVAGEETTLDGKTAEHTDAGAMVPVRPKHIDQYVHLLPKQTQERAAQVKDLLRELDVAREKARLLMEAPQASADERAAWAKRAVECDNKVKGIYSELDAEWEKLVKQGRVVVDALGNARVEPDADATGVVADERTAELTQEQKARKKSLRKWLLDLRYGKGDGREEYQKKWREKFAEYATLDAEAYEDEKILKAAEHFGVAINKDKQTDKQG